MRPIGMFQPLDGVPIVPDTVGAAVISSAGAVVSLDYPSTRANLALFSGTVDFYVNFISTSVQIPSTNSAGTTSSSGLNELNPGLRQIPSGSTGYSLTGPSSGIVTVSFWSQ